MTRSRWEFSAGKQVEPQLSSDLEYFSLQDGADLQPAAAGPARPETDRGGGEPGQDLLRSRAGRQERNPGQRQSGAEGSHWLDDDWTSSGRRTCGVQILQQNTPNWKNGIELKKAFEVIF